MEQPQLKTQLHLHPAVQRGVHLPPVKQITDRSAGSCGAQEISNGILSAVSRGFKSTSGQDRSKRDKRVSLIHVMGFFSACSAIQGLESFSSSGYKEQTAAAAAPVALLGYFPLPSRTEITSGYSNARASHAQAS